MIKKIDEDLVVNVTQIEPENSLHTGVLWGKIDADMVPIFEEQSVRIKHGYSVQQWAEEDPMEKAMIVAVERIDLAMESIRNDAEARKLKKIKNSRKG